MLGSWHLGCSTLRHELVQRQKVWKVLVSPWLKKSRRSVNHITVMTNVWDPKAKMLSLFFSGFSFGSEFFYLRSLYVHAYRNFVKNGQVNK